MSSVQRTIPIKTITVAVSVIIIINVLHRFDYD